MGLRLRLLRFFLKEFVKPGPTQEADPDALCERVERMIGMLSARSGGAPMRQLIVLETQASAHAPALEQTAVGDAAERRETGTLLYFAGCGHERSSPKARRTMLRALTRELPLRVLALDGREHPHPAAFDDALAAWETVRSQDQPPERIALAGLGPGGGTALALTAALTARGERPGAVVAFSPWTDLAQTGGSLTRNAARETTLSPAWLKKAADRYLAGGDPRDPRASPLYATFENPPPILIQVGSTEALKDDSLRMVEALRRAGGDVRLELLRDAPHLLQLFEATVPEAAEAVRSACAFVIEHLAAARAGAAEAADLSQTRAGGLHAQG